MTYIEELGRRAKEVSKTIGNASTKRKNDCLEAIASALWEQRNYILEQNAVDIANGRQNDICPCESMTNYWISYVSSKKRHLP